MWAAMLPHLGSGNDLCRPMRSRLGLWFLCHFSTSSYSDFTAWILAALLSPVDVLGLDVQDTGHAQLFPTYVAAWWLLIS